MALTFPAPVTPFNMQESEEQKLMRELEEMQRMQEKYAGNILPPMSQPAIGSTVRPPMAPPSMERPPNRPPAPRQAPQPTREDVAMIANSNMPPAQKKGLLDMIGLGGVDSGDALMALGSGMLALSQNQGLQKMGMAGFGQIAENKEQRKAIAQRNKTVEALRDAGREDLAKAVESGSLKGSDAYKMLLEGGDTKVVGKSMVRFDPQTGKVDVLYTDTSGSGDDATTAAFRTLQARAEAAGLKPGTQEYAQFMIDGGSKSGFAMRMNADGSVEFVQGSGALKPLTEGQSNAVGFHSRMSNAQQAINDLEAEGTDVYGYLLSKVPLTNAFQSPDFQRYQRAKTDFITAILRKESGAAIGVDEFVKEDQKYFPQVGDSPEVIADKRRAREIAIESMKTSSGVSADTSSTGGEITYIKDANGNYVRKN